MLRIIVILCFGLVLTAACTPTADNVALPTLADFNAAVTVEPETTAEVTSAPASTRELPPTWTPSPPPTVPPTDAADVPTAAPANYRPLGTLYYIFNNDAIVELAADGSFEELLPIPHIGQNITGLALSPDQTELVYVAPGAGSAREIYATDRTGSSTRQVTQLGFAQVAPPVWNPDGTTLAFLAAQGDEFPFGIYSIRRDGAGQRSVTPFTGLQLSDLVWSNTGEKLFFAYDGAVHGLNVAAGEVTPPLTVPTGFGPDHALAHSPTTNRIYYLKAQRDMNTGETGGILAFFDSARNEIPASELRSAQVFYDSLRFSTDGDYLLLTRNGDITVQNQTFGSSILLVSGGQVDPRPVMSPDSAMVAFVDHDANGVEQIFTVSRQGGPPTQITFHQEGTINNLTWAAG